MQVERLLINGPATQPETIYQRYKTYLCMPIVGEASPGYEPEYDTNEHLGYVKKSVFIQAAH